MDEVDVEIAPGADLSADPSTWTWVNLCAASADYPNGRVQRPVTVHTGRESEGSSSGPSWCDFTVRNEDGAFTPANPTGPWYGLLDKGTPLRVTWSTSERFSGFISELPTTWLGVVDNSRVRVRADGVTRRLEQGAEALRSAAFRSLSNNPDVVAYWPCEDNEGATRASSPIEGVNPWRMPADFGAIDGPPGSDQLALSPLGSSSKAAPVPNHTPGDVYVVEQAFRIDEDESAARHMLHVFTTSEDLAHWLIYIDDTNFGVRAWDAEDVLVVDDTEALDHSLFGQWLRVELLFRTSGTSVAWEASITIAEADGAILNSLSATETSSVKGRVTKVGSAGGVSSQDRYFGHLAVLTGTLFELPQFDFMDPLTSEDRHAPYHGWTGELAADRFERLCSEEGLTCMVLAPTGGLRESTGVNADNASTPDAAALDITGDIDLRCWLAADNWADGNFRKLVQKWEATGDQRSYALQLGNDGEIELLWSTDGTAGTESIIGSNEVLTPMPTGDDFLAVRATLDVDNGASGHDVNIYFGPSLDGPWTQHYTETVAGTTSIHSGTASLKVAGDGNFTSFGVIRGARVYDGIDGTLVADPDFTAQTIGDASFDDDAGNTWTVNGDAAIVRADDSMPMGPQQIDTLVANFQDVAQADGGILTDLTYRTRTHIYNQTPVEIEFCDLNGAPELSDDDQSTRNDVTVARHGGSSVRLVDTDHIARYGRYDESVTLNLATADDALQMAGWRLGIGTTEAARWPIVPLMISTETQHLLADWLALRIGDRITIPHDVPQLPGVDVDLLVQGWTETIYSRRAERTLNCVPASPYDVAVFGTARFDAAGSTTSGSFVAGTGTSLTVTSTGRPWVNSSDHASEFPLHVKVSGVVLNVTAISGSTSPQTFTVDAATVNGVEKTIPSGSAVALADTPVFAL
jgi:hypothetical protein